jgi:hypothetical protein
MFALKEELLAILAARKKNRCQICCRKLTPGWVKSDTKSAAELMSELLSLQDSAAYGVVRVLVEYGAQPNLQLNQYGNAADNIFLGELNFETKDLLAFLVRHGADFDHVDAEDNEIFKFYQENKAEWLTDKCSVQAMPSAGPTLIQSAAMFRPSYPGLRQRYVSCCHP